MGSLPLRGPHDGYEGILLARGLKPSGLLCTAGAPGEPPIHCDETFEREILDQILIADEAVAAGKLRKYVVVIPPPNFFSDQHTLFNNFYAQPEHEDDMRLFAEGHRAIWLHGHDAPPGLTKETGEYFGYAKADLTPPHSNRGARFLLHHTNDFRRYCRMRALLSKPAP
ncbi:MULTISPECIES: hypothetical protein [unclassified Bradyrhizobium]|uniref:hypothetical protein n=1 Tax=unclassified Bradyrhizobium TaxID=2631580 RepID=UPI0023B15E97|nr:hypothetical protein [Bradyrhizobium sp. CSS354]MDE5461538.1 hypothetical protein [Bradyrhizobium sp. CSS354]